MGLSLSLTLDIAGLSIGPGSTQGNPNLSGHGGGSAQVNAQPFPITLSAPLPFERPDLGDGYNQYVYDTEPNGELDIVSQILLPNASSADTSWMVFDPTTPYADLYFTPTISGQQPYQWQPYDGSIVPRTITPTRTVTNGLSFVGLPQDNSGFGDHTTVMKVYSNSSYHDSQAAHIQTFFDGENMASNWPNADGSPNWMHYYNQIYPYNEFSYNGQSYALTDGGYVFNLTPLGQSQVGDFTGTATTDPDNWRFSIALGPHTMDNLNLPVFKINSNKRIQTIGVLKISGIHQYERVCAHEQAHIKLWLGCKDKTKVYKLPNFYDSQGNKIQMNWIGNDGNPIVDTDGDGIPDDVENKYGLNPEETDTTLYFTSIGVVDDNNDNTNISTYGDVECLCEIAALGEVVKHKGDCLVDWSSKGLQYGSHPVYSNVPPGIFYPYEFSSSDVASPGSSVNPPQAALKNWDQIISDIASK